MVGADAPTYSVIFEWLQLNTFCQHEGIAIFLPRVLPPLEGGGIEAGYDLRCPV